MYDFNIGDLVKIVDIEGDMEDVSLEIGDICEIEDKDDEYLFIIIPNGDNSGEGWWCDMDAFVPHNRILTNAERMAAREASHVQGRR
jgi:hypothetical protein